MALQEFTSADEMRAFYKQLDKNKWARKPPEKPKPAVVESAPEPAPIPVVVAEPTSEPGPEPQRQEIELPEYPYPKIKNIIRRVARKYNVPVIDIISDRRAAGFVFPRHIAIHLACLLTPHSLPFIGRYCGGRDHATVYHAHKKMTRRRAEDKALDEELTALAAEIMGDCDAVDPA